MSDFLDALQWPGMLTNVLGAWLLTSRSPRKRHWGFWVFLASNACWTAWGLHVGSYALVALQAALVGLNIKGLSKTDVDKAPA